MSSISFEKHLPQLFLQHLQRFDETQPFTVRLNAAVMMTDISGFSALAMALTRDGAHGVETLRQVLDDYFGSLGAIVASHGGDIATFAGDAVIALWPAERGMADAARLAAQCALQIQHDAPGWSRGRSLDLTQRIAISCGEVLACKLGGFDGKWLIVFAGQPVVDAGRACDVTTPGEVLLTAPALGHLRDAVQSSAMPYDGHARLERLNGANLLPPPRLETDAPPLDAQRLAAYIPEVLVRRAHSGHDEWLEEFRVVTVMFVKLDGIDFSDTDSPDGAGALQAMTHAVQEAVHRYGGAMPYVQMDDKGLNFIVAFGIPTATHEDDSARALRAGLDIQRKLRGSGMQPSIGVATGMLYCGECGAAHRRQYSMIGPAINFAARLAGAAPDDLLCDEETAKAVRGRLSFTVAHNVRPKHADATVLALRPEWRDKAPGHQRVGAMVGRSTELRQLLEALECARGGIGARVLVSGEPGIGKSRLLRELGERCGSLGFGVLDGAARSLERNTPYFVWRELLGALLERLGQSGEAARDTLLRQLRDVPLDEAAAELLDSRRERGGPRPGPGGAQLLQWAPLLNDIVPLGIADSALTQQMRGTARASSLQALLLHLAARACEAGPLLLVVDDLHWIDDLSGQALLALCERLASLSVVAGSRPQTDQASAVAADFGRLAGVHRLSLGALAEVLGREVIARLFGVETVPDELSRLIHERSGGNPFYTEQLALELRESGHVEIVGGRCKLREDIAERAAHALPDNLRGVITSRVDRLGGEQELVLKVACVFGRVFDEDGISAVHPVQQPRERVAESLGSLLDSNLIFRAREQGDTSYAFTHVIVQEAIYELLPLAQRKRLHHRVADWLEVRHAGAMAGAYGVLASHCLLADEFARALNHLEGGALTAMRHAAYREAIGQLHTAQRVAQEHQLDADALRQARWQSLLGDSHHELSEFVQAKTQYLKVLALLGEPFVEGRAVRLGSIVKHLALQALPARRAVREAAAPEALRLASHAYAQLSELYYHENNPLTVLQLTLLSVHRAQRAGAEAELAAGYGALAIGFGQAGLVGVARSYMRRSIELAESRSGDTNGIAYAHLLAIVHASSQCDWDTLDRSGGRAATLYSELGEPFRLAAVRSTRAVAAIQRGRFDEAAALLDDMRRAAALDTPPRVMGWHLVPELQLGIAFGRVDRARVEEAQRNAANVESLVDRLMSLGSVASAWLHLGDAQRALEAAAQGLELLLGHAPVAGAGFVYGPLGVVEVLLACRDRVAADDRPGHDKRTARACAMLRIYTQQVPSTRPRGHFLLACQAENKGSARRAVALWRKAASSAKALSMPGDEAAALLALGQRLPAGNAELAQAQLGFEALRLPMPRLFQPIGTV